VPSDARQKRTGNYSRPALCPSSFHQLRAAVLASSASDKSARRVEVDVGDGVVPKLGGHDIPHRAIINSRALRATSPRRSKAAGASAYRDTVISEKSLCRLV
jgi:hypothetical protein